MDLMIQELIDDWKQRVNDLQKANYKKSVKYNNYHYRIGLPASILTIITAIILLTEAEETRFKITVGIVGITAVSLTVVQTFYSLAKRSEKHRFVVSQLIHVRRDIEILERFVPESELEREQRIHQIDERILNIEKDAPILDITIIPKKWPWILLGFSSASVLIIILFLSSTWLGQMLETRQAEENWIRESAKQGTETWVFDPNDPLLEQRVILVNTWINEITTQKVITLLAYLNEQDNEKPITMYLVSIGGYSKDSYAISQAIQESDSLVNTVTLGDCFSACTNILMSGTGDRKIAQNSRIAVHVHSYPYDDDPYSTNTILYQREWDFFQKYSDIPVDWINREDKLYYLSPEQAVAYQIADEVLK